MTERQKAQLLELLWDCMKRDPEHKDRVRTGWGTKTQTGLLACIERITLETNTISEKTNEIHGR